MSGSDDPAPSLRDRILAAGSGASISFLGGGGDADGGPVSLGRLTQQGSRRFGPTAESDVVAVILTNDRPSVEVVMGAIAVDARLVSLPLPPRGGDLDAYRRAVLERLRLTGADTVVARDDIARLLSDAGVSTRPHSALDGAPLAAPGAGFSLVQFSSGSTGPPQGVLLGDRALAANLDAIVVGLDLGPGDGATSWLPLSHDMGLVGMLLTSMVIGGPDVAGSSHLALLDPTQFLRDPRQWSDAVAAHRSTVSAMPDFALRLMSRRGIGAGAGLEVLRCLIIGGEIVRPETLIDFSLSTGTCPEALCPAYGMAEVGLAVSIDDPRSAWRSVTLGARAAAEGAWAEPDGPDDRLSLALCGAPLPGYEVSTVGDESATAQPLGRLTVVGPSIGRDVATGTSLGTPLSTGDLGFVHEGRIGVLGRLDDVIVVHGRNVHAPFVEHGIGEVDGVRPGRCAAIVLPTGEFVMVLEAVDSDTIGNTETVRRVTARLAGASPDAVVVIPRGELPMTPSGKLRRREVAQLSDVRCLSGAFESI